MTTEESPSIPGHQSPSLALAPTQAATCDLVDPWENITRNLTKVLEEESPQPSGQTGSSNGQPSELTDLRDRTAGDPVVVIRPRPPKQSPDVLNRESLPAQPPTVTSPDYSSKAMFGDLAKSLSRYVIAQKGPGSCSPPPGLGPLPSPTANGTVLGTLPIQQQPNLAAVPDKSAALYEKCGSGGASGVTAGPSLLRHPERCFNQMKNVNIGHFDGVNRNRHSIASINELTHNTQPDFNVFPINEVGDQALPSVQTDHLMHLLSGRLCVLEDTSSSIDKKIDAYEYHCRKKLEDCRQQLRKRIDELVEAYGKEIGLVVATRRKSLQRLERAAEEHLAATNKLLTQAKLKLSRMKITNEELHALNDRLLDSLVKTKKMQRETNEFNCWLDFVPKDPLEQDDCLGSLQYSEQQEPPLPNEVDQNASIRKASTLNPYAENWEPHLGQSGATVQPLEMTGAIVPGQPPQPILRNFSLDDNDFTLGAACRRSVGPANLSASVAPSAPTTLLVSCNRRNSWHPMMQSSAKTMELGCLATSEQQTEDLLLARGRRSTWATCLASSAAAAAIKGGQFQQQHLVFPYKNCIQLLPTAPAQALSVTSNRIATISNIDDISAGNGGVYMRRKHYSPPLNRVSLGNQHKSSLLTLDMQRPSVVDCYGEPPRHLKCIKGLCFMSPNRLLICENGRRNGHKNVLMFSLTGSFLSYVNPSGTPFCNPTGICVMQSSTSNTFQCSDETVDTNDQKLMVVDGSQLKLVCINTGQLIAAYPLVDGESVNACNGEDMKTTVESGKDGRPPAELSTFHRQDRFGGLHAVDNLVYVCDRKSPSVKVFDIRASRTVAEWTCPDVQNPNFVYRKKDYIYVSDSASNNVIIFTAAGGSRVGELRASCNAKNLFNNPCGICDDGDNLAVADLYNNRIQLFAKDCLIGSIYSPCIESPFSIAYHSMGVMAISNGRPRTVTLYFSSLI